MSEKEEYLRTIKKAGYGEYEEKKSRFLGEALPVTSAEEAAAHLDRIRKQHYNARHHCSAYVIGENRSMQKASDDGEPSGTAGVPILKVIEGLNCINVLVVVTRYFGGTLLGTGGLARAYTEAAKRALEDAGPVVLRKGEILEIVLDYGFLSAVQYYLAQNGLQTVGTEYTDHVVCRVVAAEEEARAVRERMRTLSGGRIEVRTVEKGLYG